MFAHSTTRPPRYELPTDLNAVASRLDRLADMELHHGHLAAAERLAWQAAALRHNGAVSA